jgi:hypothetical protein
LCIFLLISFPKPFLVFSSFSLKMRPYHHIVVKLSVYLCLILCNILFHILIFPSVVLSKITSQLLWVYKHFLMWCLFFCSVSYCGHVVTFK